MATPELDEALRRFYDQVESPRRGERVSNLAASWAAAAWGGALVAVCAAALTIFSLVEPSPREAVTQEVWTHFLNLDVPVVETDSFVALDQALERLDFRLTPPRLPLAFSLKGGKHCSLDGRVAAQAILEDDAGRAHALYVTRATDRLRQLPAESVATPGGRVRIWSEGQLFYALASPVIEGAQP
ncbi:MAG: hypothetical protein AAGD10_10985 [Myxococcota bacterium]